MGIVLRDYQAKLLSEARDLMRCGERSIILCSPTGSGKTALTAHMLRTASEKGMRSWFICHRRELVKQSMNAFSNEGLSHGVMSAGFPEEVTKDVQICSINTLRNRFERLRAPHLIVWDECHHLAAGTWAKIHKSFPKAFHIGLSATPQRLDGKGLQPWFRRMIVGPSVSDLISQKYLVPYKLFAPPSISLESVPVRMGDYVKSALEELLDKPKIIGSAVEHYLRLARGRRAIVFCFSVLHSRHVTEEFRLAGIRAEHLDGESPAWQRDVYIDRFRKGEIEVLCNVDLFGEGFDLPAIEAVILLRPTKSLALYLQQVGRSLRPSPGKTHSIILDHVKAWEDHGLPDDERLWTLMGRQQRKKNDSGPQLSVKICEFCFGANNSLNEKCSFCGIEFAKKPERKIEEEDGVLKEVNPVLARKARITEQAATDTLDGLIQLGRQRGYKFPAQWARHVLQARLAKKGS